jgi:hypothetical protein
MSRDEAGFTAAIKELDHDLQTKNVRRMGAAI